MKPSGGQEGIARIWKEKPDKEAHMDILLDGSGDLLVTEAGDILLADSVAQKIRTRLLWFEGEWRWNREEGMPYMESLFVKNPDTDRFEAAVREKIFEVNGVVDVKDVRVCRDPRTRVAAIRYVALTDYETIKEEVGIRWRDMG